LLRNAMLLVEENLLLCITPGCIKLSRSYDRRTGDFSQPEEIMPHIAQKRIRNAH